MADTIETKKTDEEVIKNLELLLNIEVLEDADIWDEVMSVLISNAKDSEDLLESEK